MTHVSQDASSHKHSAENVGKPSDSESNTLVTGVLLVTKVQKCTLVDEHK